MSLLSIQELKVSFGKLEPVQNLSLELEQGQTLGIVGESGCGKSLSSLAIMGLLPPTASVQAKTATFMGRSLFGQSEKSWSQMRGKDISMIFQDPMNALNPSFTIGFQLAETLKVHTEGLNRERSRARMISLLESVGIPEPEYRLKQYPHELSGGMCQRVMIAMAIACDPKLLIADEPTTALDVTIQAQILELLLSLQKKSKMGLILITHDLGVVAHHTQRISVMYAGRVVEQGMTSEVLKKPSHPYTKALLESRPNQNATPRAPLKVISGLVPSLNERPPGCQFAPRCSYQSSECNLSEPALVSVVDTQFSRCIHIPEVRA